MSTTMSQKEYLKKYLSGSDLDKKKKKKKKKDKISSHNKGMRIIEDSLDLKTVPYGYKDDDDKPTVAEVTYDDPKLKVMEEFEANKRWKRLEKPHHTQDGQESPSRSPPFRRHDSPSPPRKAKSEVGTQRKVRHDSGSPTPTRKTKNESSPARKGRHDSESPPRKFRRNTDSPRRSTHDSDSSPPRKTRSDSDDSPPWRKTRHDSDSSLSRGRHDSDSSPGRHDSSPPRRARHDSKSPTRRTRHDSGTPPWRVRHESDSPRPNIHSTDLPSAGTKKARTYSVSSDDGGYTPPYPPPARLRKDSDSSLSDGEKKKASTSAPPQRPTRHDSSASPPPPVRRKRHDSDASPPRRHDSDASPPRRHDSDLPPGGRKLSSNISDKQKKTSKSRDLTYYSDSSDSDSSDSPFAKVKKNNKDLKLHPKNKEQQQNVKGGVGNARTANRSPKRRQFKGDKVESDSSPPRRKRHDSDSSPPRKKRFNSDSSPAPQKRYDSDASPPRQKRHDSDSSPVRRKRYDSDSSPVRRKRHDSDSSPARRKRHSDSDASPPRIKKGKPGFSPPPRRKGEGQGESGQVRPERKMTTQEYLSARKKGRLKKDTPEDIARKEREAALQQQAEEKHQQWKHGVKQVQDYKKKAASDAHEMGKAFTRTADDADMNAHLKMVARKEDPMLEYLVKKDTKGSKVPVKPVYKGSFPPNRLDIRPGYRWDGVDRSNGFEKRWFEHQNNKRAHNEDAYKWSVSDM